MSDRMEEKGTDRQQDRQQRARARKKQQMKKKRARAKAVLMSVFVLLILLILLLVLNILGVFEKRSDQNLLTIRKDGAVIYEEVDDIAKNKYDKNELSSYIKDQIKAFNAEEGRGSVKLERFAWGKDKVYVRTFYKSTDLYEKFTGYDLFSGDSTEAATEGKDALSGVVKVMEGEKTSDPMTSDDLGKAHILIIAENTNVSVPGTVTGLSDSGTELAEDGTVLINSVSEEEDVVLSTVIIYE